MPSADAALPCPMLAMPRSAPPATIAGLGGGAMNDLHEIARAMAVVHEANRLGELQDRIEKAWSNASELKLSNSIGAAPTLAALMTRVLKLSPDDSVQAAESFLAPTYQLVAVEQLLLMAGEVERPIPAEPRPRFATPPRRRGGLVA